VQRDNDMIISRAAGCLGSLNQTTNHRDNSAHHNRCGGTPLTRSVLAELAVGYGGELHTSSMDQIDPGVLGHRGKA
jgi:hypothetical protein